MLGRLERRLKGLSHSEEAIREVRLFCEGLRGTKERLETWNATNALVCEPIQVPQVQLLGFDSPEDHFVVLQGDIVRTDSAYFLGERLTGHPKYVALNSSCDLVRSEVFATSAACGTASQ